MTRREFSFHSKKTQKRKPGTPPDKPQRLPAQKRDDGTLVTLRNSKPGECLWPYGLPDADMVACGRAVEHAPWCKEHRVLAYGRKHV